MLNVDEEDITVYILLDLVFKMAAETATGTPDIPNNQKELEIQNSKAYMLQTSTKSNTNL